MSSNASNEEASLMYELCNGAVRLSEAIDTAQQVVFALFSALRIYALWNRNAFLFPLIMALLLVPVVTGIYYFTTVTAYHLGPPFNTCAIATTLSIADLQRVLLAMNIAQMILSSKNFDYMDPFLNMLTPILISRFMINLRRIDENSRTMSEPTFSRFSAVEFHLPSSFVGNLGEQLGRDSDVDGSETVRASDAETAEMQTSTTPTPDTTCHGRKSDEIQEVMRESC
ncbi:hypothetical protein NM688_g8018 [Phlebia brevispora]|uniref:Uncharacterized protein n=1 Tax=Phlebia brevispora TaxID=194682 RepID=A0ACC1RYG9_9APHY|nr:hypothetical protein NM688_g8018 [Phlebia brevispora]